MSKRRAIEFNRFTLETAQCQYISSVPTNYLPHNYPLHLHHPHIVHKETPFLFVVTLQKLVPSVIIIINNY